MFSISSGSTVFKTAISTYFFKYSCFLSLKSLIPFQILTKDSISNTIKRTNTFHVVILEKTCEEGVVIHVSPVFYQMQIFLKLTEELTQVTFDGGNSGA